MPTWARTPRSPSACVIRPVTPTATGCSACRAIPMAVRWTSSVPPRSSRTGTARKAPLTKPSPKRSTASTSAGRRACR
ncbi:hypothetical protein G6F46_015162 [Rhizopus delemar]|nr:hypothetical protein G6F46_015162 [Rhizopus delemar]